MNCLQIRNDEGRKWLYPSVPSELFSRKYIDRLPFPMSLATSEIQEIYHFSEMDNRRIKGIKRAYFDKSDPGILNMALFSFFC